MYDIVKKYNNRILSKKDKKELNSLIKDLPEDVEVKVWSWYKHTRVAVIKDGFQV